MADVTRLPTADGPDPRPDSDPAEISADFSAATVVVLISIPLSMGIAIASGAPPALGLVTAVIGGLVTGSLAGCPLQITGPSAGLAVMVMEIIRTHGLGGLSMAVILAGSLQVVAGRFRLGQWFRAVSPAVIRGMLSGIGVLILASQFHVMVDDKPPGTGLQNLVTIPMALWKGVFGADGAHLEGRQHQVAAFIGLLTLISVILFKKFEARLPRIAPPPVVAVLVGSLSAWVLSLDILYVELGGSPFSQVSPPDFADLGRFTGGLVVSGIALGFVASAETLLCSTAVDQMSGRSRTDYDRELFAQGVGNLCCGFLGALPATGVITRSTANVQAGARTRNSALMVGIFLLVVTSAVPELLELIPTSSLAAVLVFIGYKLVATTPFSVLAGYGRSEIVIYCVTVAGIVSTTLLTGLMMGFGLSLAKLLYTFSHLEVRSKVNRDGERLDVELMGSATFVRLPALASALEQVPDDKEVHLHVHDLDYIDHACIDLIGSWESSRAERGQVVEVEWSELHGKYHAKNLVLDAPSDDGAYTFPARFREAIRDARVMDFQQEESFEDILHRSSDHLALELPLESAEILKHFHSGLSGGSTAIADWMAIPHFRLKGLKAPHVVIARSHKPLKIDPEDNNWAGNAPEQELKGIFLLVSPEEDKVQHLRMLGQVAERVSDPGFRKRWEAARDEEDLRDLWLKSRSFLVMTVEEGEPTEALLATPIRDFRLPTGESVALVIQDGIARQPFGSETLRAGDQVVFMGQRRRSDRSNLPTRAAAP